MADLGMKLHQGLSFSPLFLRIPKAEAVFFPGCALMQLEPRILKKTLEILRRAEPGIRLAAGCCGQPSVYLFPEQAEKRQKHLVSRLKDQGVRRIYTACPNCQVELRKWGEFEIIPIWIPLAQHLKREDLTPMAGRFVWHDPCPLRRETEQLDALRAILTMADCDFTEPEQTRAKTQCCGNVHMLRSTAPEKSAVIRRRRLAQLDESRTILSCCEGCLDAFRTEHRDARHILEYLFGESKTRSWRNRIQTTNAPVK